MSQEKTETQSYFEQVVSNNSSTISNHNTVHIETPPLHHDRLTDIDKEQEPTIAEVPLEKKEGIRHNPKGWAVVVSTFLVNFFCFGVVFQWGNFQQLYLKIYAGETDTFRISFVGTMASTVLLSSGVFLTPVIQKLGYRGTMAIGTVLAPLGMILSSFSTSLWHIYFSQGLLFGLGSGLCFAPSIALPSQFFDKNRSLATGLAVCGSGIGGVCLSPMTEKLFATLGYRNALRIEGAMGFGLLVIATALAFSNSRPGAAQGGAFSIIDKSIIDHDLVTLMAFCFLVPFGYLGPYFLNPQFVTYLHRFESDGAALVAVMSGMNSVSRIAMGFLADRLGKLNTMFACSLAAGIFTSILWQFSTSYGVYIAFCVLYGLTGGAFVSLLPVVIADIVGVKNIQRGIGMCYTITLFGSLLGTPIIGKLYQIYGWTSAIQFCGATTLGSALILLYLRMRRSKGNLILII